MKGGGDILRLNKRIWVPHLPFPESDVVTILLRKGGDSAPFRRATILLYFRLMIRRANKAELVVKKHVNESKYIP